MNDTQRAKIVEQLMRFEDSETSKVFSKYHFYYNYQAVNLAPLDESGQPIKKGKKEKDYEVISYHPHPKENERGISDFMVQHLHGRPYTLGDNKIGVEINFNKVFYKPTELPSVEQLLSEIAQLDAELAQLYKGMER